MDVGSVVDPTLIEIARDFASIATGRSPSDFSEPITILRGHKLTVMLAYKKGKTTDLFSVSIDTNTWERTYVPSM